MKPIQEQGNDIVVWIESHFFYKKINDKLMVFYIMINEPNYSILGQSSYSEKKRCMVTANSSEFRLQSPFFVYGLFNYLCLQNS